MAGYGKEFIEARIWGAEKIVREAIAMPPKNPNECDRCHARDGKKYTYGEIRDRRFTWFYPLLDHPNWSGGYDYRMVCDDCIDAVNLENPGIVYVLHDEYKKRKDDIWSPGWDKREPGADTTRYQYSLIEQKAKLFEARGIPFPDPPKECTRAFLRELERRKCDFGYSIYRCPAMSELASHIEELDAAAREHRDARERTFDGCCPFMWKHCDMRDDATDQLSKLEYMFKHGGRMP